MCNMFRMDMCDNICKLIIVTCRVTFVNTSEHRTSQTEQSKTEQSDLGWCFGVIQGMQGCGSSSPFE